MARLGRQRLLGLLLPKGDWWLLRRTVVLPVSFLLGAPFSTTLGADEVALSFPFSFFSSSFLRVVADALTNAFCLAASISAKDKGQEVKHKDNKEEIRKGKFTTMGVFVQPTCYRRQLWTPIVCVQCVKSNQVFTLSLLKQNIKNPTYKSLMLISYARASTG